MSRYIYWFDEIRPRDFDQVGGKNASLGLMIRELSRQDIAIPNGFALSADAYWYYLKHNRLLARMKKIMRGIKDYSNLAQVQNAGREVRALITDGTMPEDLREDIITAYNDLSVQYHVKNCDVAVRSSATAEDLPHASFAGQQETFLNIKGEQALIQACKESMASLFTDRAIVYRKEHKFDHFKVALSVGVQKMIRSDKAAAGVAFSLDPQTGFKNVIMIDSAWGLGESIVKGIVNPDQFYIFKPTLDLDYQPIIKKVLGDKRTKLVYHTGKNPTKQVSVSAKDQNKFSLSDQQVVALAHMINTIDEFYTAQNGHWTPMDIEWAQDGIDGKLYIVQARPETVHSQKKEKYVFKTYTLNQSRTLREPPVYAKATPGRQGERGGERHRTNYSSSVRPEAREGSRRKFQLLVSGVAIGQQIVSGVARVVKSAAQIKEIKAGDIIITSMTDPDWVPVMKKAAGIITDLGGRTCHAAIVSRELGIPAIVGTHTATKTIKNGQKITIDCAQGADGFVYNGAVPFQEKEISLEHIPQLKTKLMVNIADPDSAFAAGMLPTDGVGLARIEFIIANDIKIHPMALLDPKQVTSAVVKKKIKKLTEGYKDKKQYFVDTLVQGISMIAAAFYPRPVIVRLSDFKTNEYHNLIGGEFFEQEEANPMLGFRGASRYTHELYEKAFALECKALKYAREKMGFDNIKIMVPFVRTVQEAEATLKLLAQHGLERKGRTLAQKLLRKSSSLEIIMMVELPSNVLLINQFAKLFDGFSIGSNDLTQLTLGVDRDSALLRETFDERDPAVKQIIADAIKGAHKAKRPIGICGQGPSDYPEFAQFLIEHKIDSISLNSDSVLPFLLGLL